MGAGIDYGMGRSNVDVKTGIRYGVISQNSVCLEFTDFEYDYGEPTCPKCGSMNIEEVTGYDGDVESFARNRGSCDDYVCVPCEHLWDSSEVYSEESVGWHYDQDGYQLTDCLDNDIFVLASPYYTFAAYCSPCVPGAGNLDSAIEDGAKTYCLGHDWFEDGKAPYPVYDVATGEELKRRGN